MASSTTPSGTPAPESPPQAPSSETPSEPHPLHSPEPESSRSTAPEAESKLLNTSGEGYRKYSFLHAIDRTLERCLVQTDNHIQHLNRLLTSTPSLDLILGTTSYTLTLLTHLLTPLPSTPNSLLTRSQPLRSSLSTLSFLLSETRVTLRLFGLVGIYTWAKSLWDEHTLQKDDPSSTPRIDTLITNTITLTQLTAGIVFQLLENLAHLGDKRILPFSSPRRSKYWLWCSRAWALHVFLELLRLARERHLIPKLQEAKTSPEMEKGMRTTEETRFLGQQPYQKEREERWWKEFKVNMAYAPMTVHYSLHNGALSEGMLALCGVLASGWGLKGAWTKTRE